METNPLQRYISTELKKAVDSVQVKTGMTKEGNTYYYISLKLINGYEKKLFVNDAERFAFISAFESLPTIRSLDED